jgi:phage shock protein A
VTRQFPGKYCGKPSVDSAARAFHRDLFKLDSFQDLTTPFRNRSTTVAKQSIFGRIAQLAKANINALIDQAEDPQLMLDQLVRDFSANISDAESAIAQTIGNLRLLEDDHREDVASAEDWGRKALAASQRADEFRASGNGVDADKFDALAKVALTRQLQSESEARAAEPSIATQTEVVDKLKSGLNMMREKLGDLTRKRDELAARAKSVAAQSQVQDALKSINVLDPTSELGRFEDKIRREEAKVRGASELAASSLDAQFEQLEDLGQLTEVDARLAALKADSAKQIGQ